MGAESSLGCCPSDSLSDGSGIAEDLVPGPSHDDPAECAKTVLTTLLSDEVLSGLILPEAIGLSDDTQVFPHKVRVPDQAAVVVKGNLQLRFG